MEEDSVFATVAEHVNYENLTSYETYANYSNLIVYALAVSVLLITVLKTMKIYKSETPNQIGLMGIWFLGLLSFMVSIVSFMLSMLEAFDTIQAMGEISPAGIAGGIKYATLNITQGYLIFLVSIIIWGILKGILNNKIRKTLSSNNL